MREKIGRIFYGRQGMDELSKTLFWSGLVCVTLSLFLGGILNGVLSSLFSWLGIFQIILCFVRAFSHKLTQRESENAAFLSWVDNRRQAFADFKARRSQSRDFKFFKCPGCGTMLRVPRGKGKIHIKCKCGYTLYRRT